MCGATYVDQIPKLYLASSAGSHQIHLCSFFVTIQAQQRAYKVITHGGSSRVSIAIIRVWFCDFVCLSAHFIVYTQFLFLVDSFYYYYFYFIDMDLAVWNKRIWFDLNKTKTAETKIVKLDTGVVYHDTNN